MKPVATIVNTLWGAMNLPSYRRFVRALQNPKEAQWRRLRGYLQRDGRSAFGRKHEFYSITSYEEFARRVPLSDYDALEPWIQRIRRGEHDVLTCEPVTRLVPTSGSMRARKLIPFTAGLQAEFNAAIGPWLGDLMRQSPGIVTGPAYWSITPATKFAEEEASAVPIGFDDDTAYLGGTRQWLANEVMAVPSALSRVQDTECFRYLTLLCLLRQRELRLISVWHPSFLTLLLEALPRHWEELLADIRKGECKYAERLQADVLAALKLRAMPGLADELRSADARKPETLWPHLKLISCWRDGAANIPAGRLVDIFSNTWIQAKGLLATEACITIPFAGHHPVAVASHFFEFMDEAGKVFCVDQLQRGQTYEVIVTTGGGLWRYRLGDCVRVDGFVRSTPSLQFLGRSGNVSDLCGEKLAEAFVVQALQGVLAESKNTPGFVFLAPDTVAHGNCYTLYTDGALSEGFSAGVDQALRQNPHYAYCRDLGQLSAVRVFVISERAEERFLEREVVKGRRLGDVKPIAFSNQLGWSGFFKGRYG